MIEQAFEKQKVHLLTKQFVKSLKNRNHIILKNFRGTINLTKQTNKHANKERGRGDPGIRMTHEATGFRKTI